MRNGWKRFTRCLPLLLLFSGCSRVTQIYDIPDVVLGEPSFFPTIEAHTTSPIIGGNGVQILLNGDETFPIMLEEIRRAQRTITMVQYLYRNGAIGLPVAEAIAERCRAGVRAKILLDAFGSISIPAEIPELMEKAGCEVRWFRRIKILQFLTPWALLRHNYRNHRRALVVDGKVAFTGGYGISEEWLGDGKTEGRWRETNVRVEGPVVHQFQAAFAESWRETTGVLIGGDDYFPRLSARGAVYAQAVRSSPLGGSFQSYMLFLLSINSARRSIYLTNPYFLPDDRMSEALLKAARREVRVVLLLPGKLDNMIIHRASRRGYGPLLRGGIEIFEYQPALLHSKTLAVDGIWATIGSSNFENRSFGMNEELNLTVYDKGVAGQLEKVFFEDLKYSKRITYEEWKSRGWGVKILELFTFPLREQL